MKQKLIVMLLALICLSGVVAQAASSNSEVSTSTPFRLSVWPGGWAWPAGVNVYGWNFGIPAAFQPDKKLVVYGLDCGILYSETNNIKGVQGGFWCKGNNIQGVQGSFANFDTTNFDGFQAAIYNEYKNSAGCQFGIVNVSKKSKGVQIGLLNFMDNGFLPVFPFVNWGGFK
ncbi:MAG TPA: hypothetical protein QF753_07390 [Victivallales bacterium]|nr:hypothetical protein [Victivallales bacterium]